jgi:surface carbohydrate biosynthesis protein
MLTFGCLIGEEYSRYIAGTVVPIGSMKNNLVRKMPAKQKGVIGYISTWRKVSARLYGEHYTEHT